MHEVDSSGAFATHLRTSKANSKDLKAKDTAHIAKGLPQDR